MSYTGPSAPSVRVNRSLRILCADDSKPIRDLLQLLLTQDGHEVTTVADGLCAHELMQHAPDRYDILITDHNMPGMTGLELLAALRAAQFRGAVIVLCSPLPSSVADVYRRHGVSVMLDKPVGFSALRQAVLLLEHFVAKDPEQNGVTPGAPNASPAMMPVSPLARSPQGREHP